MALGQFRNEVWSAALLIALEEESVYQALCSRQYEPDAQDARKVHIGNVTGDVTVSDYSEDTDITDPQVLTDADTVLELDQKKYFHLYVDDVHQVQSRPRYMAEYLRKAAIKIAQTKDTYVSTTIMNANVVAGNQFTYSKTLTAAKDIGKELLSKFIDMRKTVDEADVPASMRQWAVITPSVKNYFLHWMLETAEDAGGLWIPTTDEAMLARGMIGNLVGFDLISTNRAPQVNTKDAILFGTDRAVIYADQIMNMEMYRPEKRFGDAVKGLYVYAGKVVHTAELWRLARIA